jgi:hypothetical protein
LISAGSRPWNFSAPQPTGWTVEPGDEEQPGGRDELLGLGADAHVRDRTRRRSARRAREVGPQAEPRRLAGRVLGGDLDELRGEQPLDRRHRVDEVTTLALVEMVEQRTRELVTAAVQLGPLGPARLGQPDDPRAAVVARPARR